MRGGRLDPVRAPAPTDKSMQTRDETTYARRSYKGHQHNAESTCEHLRAPTPPAPWDTRAPPQPIHQSTKPTADEWVRPYNNYG